LQEIADRVPFRHIIFCQGRLSFAEIIAHWQHLPRGITARIHARGSGGIVTSRSRDSSGEIVSREAALKLANPYNRRLKRLIDAVTGFLFILTFPVHLFFVKRPFHFLMNSFLVLVNRKTWIGYTTNEKHLPALRPGIIGCNGLPPGASTGLSRESLHMVDYWYARDYEPLQDLKMLLRRYRLLGS
jgi:hypothetical protein